VIGGQQRFTILTVLIAALASFKTGDDASLLRDFMRQKPNKYATTEAVMRVTLRPPDRDMFRDLVQCPPNLDDLLANDPAQLDNDAQRCTPRPVEDLSLGRCTRWLRSEIVLCDQARGGSRSDGERK
jgi:hypothetical protein